MEALFPQEALEASIEANERSDGRTLAHSRQINVETGVLQAHHGSALARAGISSVSAAVTIAASDSASKPSLSVHCEPELCPANLKARSTKCMHELAERVHAALLDSGYIKQQELYVQGSDAHTQLPLSVQLILQPLGSDGSLYPLSVACACAALYNASVPLHELVDTTDEAKEQHAVRLPLHGDGGDATNFPQALAVGIHRQNEEMLDPTTSELPHLNALVEASTTSAGSLVNVRALCGRRPLTDAELVSACSAAASQPPCQIASTVERNA